MLHNNVMQQTGGNRMTRSQWEDYRNGPPPKVHLSVSIPCKKG